MNILKTIKNGDTMLDLINNVISNIKFYVKHREELNDIKLSNEFLYEYVAKLEEVKSRYETTKICNWFKEFNPSLLLSSEFPHIKTLLGFTFSLYDMINMMLCEDRTYVYSEKEIYIIETTKLIDQQNVMVYFKDGSSFVLNKDEWDVFYKNLI